MLNRDEALDLKTLIAGAIHQLRETGEATAIGDLERALPLAQRLVDFTEKLDAWAEDPNYARARTGDRLLQTLTALTGVERESSFGDAVSYLLHSEMYQLSHEDEHIRTEADARALLDAAFDSFLGDREDGPYAWEPSEDD